MQYKFFNHKKYGAGIALSTNADGSVRIFFENRELKNIDPSYLIPRDINDLSQEQRFILLDKVVDSDASCIWNLVDLLKKDDVFNQNQKSIMLKKLIDFDSTRIFDFVNLLSKENLLYALQQNNQKDYVDRVDRLLQNPDYRNLISSEALEKIFSFFPDSILSYPIEFITPSLVELVLRLRPSLSEKVLKLPISDESSKMVVDYNPAIVFDLPNLQAAYLLRALEKDGTLLDRVLSFVNVKMELLTPEVAQKMVSLSPESVLKLPKSCVTESLVEFAVEKQPSLLIKVTNLPLSDKLVGKIVDDYTPSTVLYLPNKRPYHLLKALERDETLVDRAVALVNENTELLTPEVAQKMVSLSPESVLKLPKSCVTESLVEFAVEKQPSLLIKVTNLPLSDKLIEKIIDDYTPSIVLDLPNKQPYHLLKALERDESLVNRAVAIVNENMELLTPEVAEKIVSISPESLFDLPGSCVPASLVNEVVKQNPRLNDRIYENIDQLPISKFVARTLVIEKPLRIKGISLQYLDFVYDEDLKSAVIDEAKRNAVFAIWLFRNCPCLKYDVVKVLVDEGNYRKLNAEEWTRDVCITALNRNFSVMIQYIVDFLPKSIVAELVPFVMSFVESKLYMLEFLPHNFLEHIDAANWVGETLCKADVDYSILNDFVQKNEVKFSPKEFFESLFQKRRVRHALNFLENTKLESICTVENARKLLLRDELLKGNNEAYRTEIKKLPLSPEDCAKLERELVSGNWSDMGGSHTPGVNVRRRRDDKR